MADRTGFDEFVAARSPNLLRFAFLLTTDPTAAQDLLQEALLKSWFRWSRIATDPELYVRRVLVNTYISGRRRRWHGELANDGAGTHRLDWAALGIEPGDSFLISVRASYRTPGGGSYPTSTEGQLRVGLYGSA
ncbi:MAG: hypothetical protein L0Y54_08095 [Sporichthyaceae bacterium]|nr:hypothetical protein [Sporichthyaceae bacterium]